MTLWQSRMLRPVRLKVLDEVRNGVTYFKETFFTELPRLYIQATQQLQKRYPEKSGRCRPSSASAAGSAATATAIPSSPPKSCVKPCACNRPRHSITISKKFMSWAANCRSPTC